MSFYRTYRPQVIDEIDNPRVAEQLLSLLSKDVSKLPHAYLFTGPKGTGKTTAARLVAKIFNCTKLTKNGPCGKCDQCQSIANGNNLDVLEIDAASNRGIDEMRELRDRISLAPASAKYKVYIIDEVHMLTTEAFNALLKTLEEPPKHAVFVLATTDPQKVIATIKSRCLVIPFNRASNVELKHALIRIVTAEKLSIDDEVLEALAGYADGSFRDAVKMLEQLSFHSGRITKEVVEKLLTVTDDKNIELFLESLSSRNAKECLTIVNEIVQNGRDMKSFIMDILGKLEKILVAEATGTHDKNWTIDSLEQIIGLLTKAWGEMKFVAIAQLPLELAVVEFCQTKAISDPSTALGTGKREVTSKNEDKIVSDNTDVSPLTSHVLPPDDGKVQQSSVSGSIDLQKLTDHWLDFIESMKPYNHSIAGVLRSARPKSVGSGIVIIEAFYKFHLEKLSEMKTREAMAEVLRKLFGEKVKVEVVLGKK